MIRVIRDKLDHLDFQAAKEIQVCLDLQGYLVAKEIKVLMDNQGPLDNQELMEKREGLACLVMQVSLEKVSKVKKVSQGCLANKEDLALKDCLVHQETLELLAYLAEMAKRETMVCQDYQVTEGNQVSVAHQECLEETDKRDQKV